MKKSTGERFREYQDASIKGRRVFFEEALAEIKQLRDDEFKWKIFEEDIRIQSGAGKTLRKELPKFIRALRGKADAHETVD